MLLQPYVPNITKWDPLRRSGIHWEKIKKEEEEKEKQGVDTIFARLSKCSLRHGTGGEEVEDGYLVREAPDALGRHARAGSLPHRAPG